MQSLPQAVVLLDQRSLTDGLVDLVQQEIAVDGLFEKVERAGFDRFH
jgi:hypothetical protein